MLWRLLFRGGGEVRLFWYVGIISSLFSSPGPLRRFRPWKFWASLTFVQQIVPVWIRPPYPDRLYLVVIARSPWHLMRFSQVSAVSFGSTPNPSGNLGLKAILHKPCSPSKNLICMQWENLWIKVNTRSRLPIKLVGEHCIGEWIAFAWNFQIGESIVASRKDSEWIECSQRVWDPGATWSTTFDRQLQTPFACCWGLYDVIVENDARRLKLHRTISGSMLIWLFLIRVFAGGSIINFLELRQKIITLLKLSALSGQTARMSFRSRFQFRTFWSLELSDYAWLNYIWVLVER